MKTAYICIGFSVYCSLIIKTTLAEDEWADVILLLNKKGNRRLTKRVARKYWYQISSEFSVQSRNKLM